MVSDYKNTNLYQQEFQQVVKQLCECGVKQEDAEIVADCFATADVFGVTTHGVSILPSHIDKIKRGGYNLFPELTIVKETAAFAVIDGDNAFGPVSAKYCLDYGVKRCKESGVFTVFGRNNNTFGPAFYYSLKAAEEGCIAFVTSNSPAQMAPFGGKEKMLGTNPFAAVIPVPDGEPIIIDFATSIVAKSKFKEYAQKGLKLPDGWALDEDGNPTKDPEKGMKGFVLPMAGFKGYGFSMLIDIIAGLLSGSAYLNHVGRFYSNDNKSMNVGFCITVMAPKLIFGDEYDIAIKQYISDLKGCKHIEGKEIILPGDDRVKYKKFLLGNE